MPVEVLSLLKSLAIDFLLGPNRGPERKARILYGLPPCLAASIPKTRSV